jgi:hypothetical protein
MSPSSRPVITSGDTTIAFDWRGDRWGHRVTVGGSLVAESVEGPDGETGDPRWPVSPVLTEVTPTTAGGRPAIVGVGLAGRSHFSASFTPHPALADTVLVEIACRVHEPPGWLGSTYRGTDGRLRRLVAGDTTTGGLPRTIQWSYLCGPRGIVAATDAACDPPADPSRF